VLLVRLPFSFPFAYTLFSCSGQARLVTPDGAFTFCHDSSLHLLSFFFVFIYILTLNVFLESFSFHALFPPSLLPSPCRWVDFLRSLYLFGPVFTITFSFPYLHALLVSPLSPHLFEFPDAVLDRRLSFNPTPALPPHPARFASGDGWHLCSPSASPFAPLPQGKRGKTVSVRFSRLFSSEDFC